MINQLYIVLKVLIHTKISFFLKNIRHLILFNQKVVILSRTACLGNDIKKLLFGKDVIEYNFQKSRVDLLLGKPSEINPFCIKKFILRDDIFFIIIRQSIDFFYVPRPKYVFIDSYSELTDQKFTHSKKKYSIFCNYSDLVIGSEFQNTFECNGLIELEKLSELYDELFAKIIAIYGQVPIFFIHFPYLLERRQWMIDRAIYIKHVVEELQSKYKTLKSISLDADAEMIKRVDDLPYHYQKEAYEAFAKKIIETGVLNVE